MGYLPFSPRSSAGLRLIAGFGFASLLRFEVVADLAVPVDERGRREEAGLQARVRLQSTVGGGVHCTARRGNRNRNTPSPAQGVLHRLTNS